MMQMTAKERALLALMEERGYSNGLIMTAMHILSQSKMAQDEMMLYMVDCRPGEQKFIEHLAKICANEDLDAREVESLLRIQKRKARQY